MEAHTDCSLCILASVKLDDTGSTRAAVWLVLYLSLLHWTDGCEEVDKVLVAGRPWKVANVDDWARLAAVRGMIGERIGSLWCERSSVHTSSSAASVGAATTTVATTKSTTPTAEASATPTEASAEASATATCETASKTATSTTESTTSTAWWSVGKSVFADLECTALPFVSVELTDSVTCVVSVVEDDDAGALGTTIRAEVDVSAYDVSDLSCKRLV